MFAWITLLLVLAALGLELFFVRIGYFRTIHWESLSLLTLACITAALGYRARKGVIAIATFLLTVAITLGMAYLTIWLPRLPIEEAPFERDGVSIELALRTPTDEPLLLPAAMVSDHALLVFYRGVW